jgi:hypothetical protein
MLHAPNQSKLLDQDLYNDGVFTLVTLFQLLDVSKKREEIVQKIRTHARSILTVDEYFEGETDEEMNPVLVAAYDREVTRIRACAQKEVLDLIEIGQAVYTMTTYIYGPSHVTSQNVAKSVHLQERVSYKKVA